MNKAKNRADKVNEVLDTLCEDAKELWKGYQEDDYNHAQYIDELSHSIDRAFEEIDEIYTKPAEPKIILETEQEAEDWSRAQFESENQ